MERISGITYVDDIIFECPKCFSRNLNEIWATDIKRILNSCNSCGCVWVDDEAKTFTWDDMTV